MLLDAQELCYLLAVRDLLGMQLGASALAEDHSRQQKLVRSLHTLLSLHVRAMPALNGTYRDWPVALGQRARGPADWRGLNIRTS
eukprot:6213150-Pleurochrysis_carterae.AAC.1